MTCRLDPDEVARLTAQGMSDRQVAVRLGVTERTVQRTRARHDIPPSRPVAASVLDETRIARERAQMRNVNRQRHALLGPDETAQAVCRQTDPELFYEPEGGPRGRAAAAEWARRLQIARAICAECPIASRCLEVALENREQWGIWAGTTADQRQEMLARAARSAS